ncbi:hypothetical protein HD553DRAFT_324400 [Filobasidium floriforme]|uniref:uncharacterized protein n=1 Tax=Filobasidium floriforme TaxID=5210 RepID=UPI001E8E6A0D|nr:uncharacterized protein HD553DRAFT_324400 [Filobasidium floriforme]KAH8083484.1 hypothetical protein HD553DRAFT_324400 [Filobasidium floriforme]
MTPYTVHLHRVLLIGIVAILLLVPAGFGHLVHRSDTDDDDSLDCRPVAFVRAADLVPNSVVPGEARLVMHGTGCRNVQKWEIGLKLKERAIFRYWQPEFLSEAEPGTCDEDDESAAYIHTPDILDRMGFLRRRACLTPEQTQYYRTLANRTLWDIKGAERTAFDSRVELALQEEGTSLWEGETFYAQRNFSVHVPNTNFPPQLESARSWGGRGDDPQTEASFTETMFEYYFVLTYKGGSTIEVPAGRAAFIPRVFGDTSPTDGIIYDNPSSLRVDLPDDERIVAQPRFVLKDFQRDLGGFDKVPACGVHGGWDGWMQDANRWSNFSVEMSLQTPGVRSDHTLPVKIKIHQSGNSTAFVDKALLTLRTCQVDTWALSHARTLNQRREVDGCRGNPSTQDDWVAAGASEDVAGIRTGNLLRQNSDMKVICIGEPFDETYKREKEELEARYRQVARRHHNNESSTEYDALEVDLYIPKSMVPAFNTSFFAYDHLLDLRLVTRFECDAPELPTPEGQPSLAYLKVEDDWRRGSMTDPTVPRHQRILYASTPIHLQPISSEHPHVSHYTDPGADAIYLTSPTSPKGESLKAKVNTTLRTLSQDHELVTNKYNIWQRLGEDGFSRGTAFELVSDIWQKKGHRRPLSS